MATVNLLNYSWSYSRDSNVEVDIDTSPSEANTQVKFTVGSNDGSGYSKAYIRVDDISKYGSIYFNYKRISQYGITSLWFGIFDSTDRSSKSGTLLFGDNGDGAWSWTKNNSSKGGARTLTIPSGLSGTKYIGFRFYGNGNEGKAKESIYINSLTLTERGYTLTYNANGGSGAPSAVSNITSTTISDTTPTRTGYNFLGWSTSSSATSASYIAGNSISLSSNVTLYAVWKQKTYAVTYNANGGSGAPSTQYKTHGETLILSSTKPTKSATSAGSYTVTLNANGGVCSYTSLSAARTTYYTFSKWNTNSSGTDTSYNAGASYTTNAALSLYAIYTSSTSTASVKLPTPTRDGYKFMGWAKSKTATSGTTGNYTPTGNVTLYAIWKPMGLVYIHDGVDFNPYLVLIYDGSSWNPYIPYIYTESGWEMYSG